MVILIPIMRSWNLEMTSTSVLIYLVVLKHDVVGARVQHERKCWLPSSLRLANDGRLRSTALPSGACSAYALFARTARSAPKGLCVGAHHQSTISGAMLWLCDGAETTCEDCLRGRCASPCSRRLFDRAPLSETAVPSCKTSAPMSAPRRRGQQQPQQRGNLNWSSFGAVLDLRSLGLPIVSPSCSCPP